MIIQKYEHGNIKSSFDYFMKFNLKKSVKILEIGCHYGTLIYNLHKVGFTNYYGIDIDKNSIKYGKKSYKEINKWINTYEGKKLPFEEESFDVILMFDVIEHIPEIEKFIKEEVYRVLKKNGIFMFQTPNKYINIPWEVINKRSFTKWKEYHLSLQTKNSLRRILEKAGFRNIIIEKNIILTEHNKNKVKKKFGFLGLYILYFLQILPLPLYPNLWGYCRK